MLGFSEKRVFHLQVQRRFKFPKSRLYHYFGAKPHIKIIKASCETYRIISLVEIFPARISLSPCIPHVPMNAPCPSPSPVHLHRSNRAARARPPHSSLPQPDRRRPTRWSDRKGLGCLGAGQVGVELRLDDVGHFPKFKGLNIIQLFGTKYELQVPL